MAIKHKVLKDFQLLTSDKKIIILKAKTVLVDYKYITKNDNVSLDKAIIDNNPDFFSPIDWKEELNTFLKLNKVTQPAILTKKLIPFIEQMFLLSNFNGVEKGGYAEKELELETRQRKIDMLEKLLQSKMDQLNQDEIKMKARQKFLDDKELELEQLAVKLLNQQK